MIVVVLVIGGWLGSLVRSARVQREAVAAIEVADGCGVLYDWQWSNGKSIPGGKPWAPRWLVDFMGVDYFSNVTSVCIQSTSAESEAAIVQVGRLNRVHSMDLFQSSLSDAGLAHLRGLSTLSELNLGGTQVTDAGLANLEGLTNLSVLNLSFTDVTDAGLAHLKGLTNLTSLDVEGCKVTDAGLAHLKGLMNMSFLHVTRTRVTDAGIEELKQALPNLDIEP
jgi:internalin A